MIHFSKFCTVLKKNKGAKKEIYQFGHSSYQEWMGGFQSLKIKFKKNKQFEDNIYGQNIENKRVK